MGVVTKIASEALEASKKQTAAFIEDAYATTAEHALKESDRLAKAKAQKFGDVWYHGTTHDIKEFGGGNYEVGNYFGKADYFSSSVDDVNVNYAGEGADLTNRLERDAEWFEQEFEALDETGRKELLKGTSYTLDDYVDAFMEGETEKFFKNVSRKRLKGGAEGVVYPVRTRVENTFDISSDGDTFLEYRMRELDPEDYMDEAADEFDIDDFDTKADYEEAVQERAQELAYEDAYNFEPEGELVDFMESIRRNPMVSMNDSEALFMHIMEVAQDGEGITGSQLDDIMRNTSWWAEDDLGNIANNEVYRQALEDVGYDSVLHDADIFGNMEGTEGAKHLVVFHPEKIRSVNAQFDPEKMDSRDILAGITTFATGTSLFAGLTDDAYADEDISGLYRDTAGKAEQQAADDFFANTSEPTQIEQPVEQAEEETTNWIEWVGREFPELVEQAAGGVLDAVNETLKTTKEWSDWLDENVLDLTIPGTEGMELQVPTIEETGETGDNLVRALFRFGAGYLTAGRILKPVKFFSNGKHTLIKEMTKGAWADYATTPTEEENLSQILQQFGIENEVIDYLAEGEGAEKRLKNTLEGLGIGAAVDGTMKFLKWYKARKSLTEQTQKMAQGAKEMGATPEQLAAGDEQFKELFEQNPLEKIDELLGKGENIVDIDGVSDDQLKAWKEAGGTTELPDYAININLNRIDTPDDIKRAINQTAETFKLDIDDARRGTISLKQTEKLADDMGMTVEELLSRNKGQAFNAEQAVAARKILASSAQRLNALAQLAAGSESSPNVLAAFRQALAVHGAIQKQVSGMTAEAGRALSSFRIKSTAGDAVLDSRMILDAIEANGGDGYIRDMATKLMVADPKALNRISREMAKPGMKDMFFEVWINGLLSSPATHVVNAVSNAVTSAWMIPERYLAAGVGKLRGTKNIQFQEGTELLYGWVKGIQEGFGAAWKTLKTGEPSDLISKIEMAEHKAVSAANLGIENQTIAKGVDLLADWSVRLPSKMLMTSDEFFKAIGYRMELNAQAYRKVVQEGLSGDAAAKRMTQLLSDTPADLKASAIDMSRYITFQKKLGEAGQAIQKFTATAPLAKLIMPFVRTPLNITKFVGERTPLGVFSKSIRTAIREGGAEGDLALAKIGLGTSMMGGMAALVQEGYITGSGTEGRNVTKSKREAGWQPYSIKIGDKYYSFQRLDPVGMTLGLVADAVEIMQYASESEDANVQQAGIAVGLAVAKNLTSKTYLSGVSDFFEMMGYASTDPEKANDYAKAYFARMAGSFVPFTSMSAQIERTIDPTLREAKGVIEYIKSRTPGLSKDLPPRRNIFGDPVILEGGLGWDFVSPVYTSTDKNDPVFDMIVDNEISLAKPRKQINGIELTTDQYDTYVLLVAGKNKDGKRLSSFTDSQGMKQSGYERTLREEMKHQMASQEFKDATTGADGKKALIIKSVYQKYVENAKKMMPELYPDLAAKLHDAEMEKQVKLMGESKMQQQYQEFFR